jgi:hypothetical protein
MSQIDKVITIKLANKMLPLVSRIVADIVESAAAVDWRQGHLTQDFDAGDDLYGDELRAIEIELERDAARLAKVQGELVSLGEDEVGFWHHRHEGFEERRSLVVSPASN